MTNPFSSLLLNKKECDTVDPVLNLGYTGYSFFILPVPKFPCSIYRGGGGGGHREG